MISRDREIIRHGKDKKLKTCLAGRQAPGVLSICKNQGLTKKYGLT